jgi:hypothetical protein
MESLGWVLTAILLAYVAVCFGKIAIKHGKNPVFYGVLSIVSPVNLVILGCWAFSKTSTHKEKDEQKIKVSIMFCVP